MVADKASAELRLKWQGMSSATCSTLYETNCIKTIWK